MIDWLAGPRISTGSTMSKEEDRLKGVVLHLEAELKAKGKV